MDALPSYSAIIVTFRRDESLAQVLDALRSQTHPPRLTVVADNDPDESARNLIEREQATWPGRLLYSPVGENLGPAGGWAHATSVARSRREDRGEWVLVLDDDDPLESPHLMERLTETAKRLEASVGALGLRGARWDARRARLVREQPPEGTTAPVHYLASGGAPLYSWAAIDEVGFFKPDLFFGFEDLDQGFRLRAAGWTVRVCPLPSLQQVADTAGTRSAWREYYKTRALIWILWNRRGVYATLLTLLRSVVLGGTRHAVADRRPDLARARLMGAWDGLRGRLGVRRYSPQTNPPKGVPAGNPDTAKMRLLFVSGVDAGGARRSTLELARRLQRAGHEVAVVLGSGAPPKDSLYGLALRGAIKLRERTGWGGVRTFLRPAGWLGTAASTEGSVTLWRHPTPENIVRRALRSFAADVVVANSLPREQMRWLVDDVHDAGIPVVLYMREDHSASHLTVSQLPFDAVLANSRHLTRQAREAGYAASFVPSIVDVDTAQVDSTRRSAVLVNPVSENRPEILRELASRRPDITCVYQESWPLAPADLAAIDEWCRNLPNLTLRRRSKRPADIYVDARLIVAPYPGGRPRTVLEAQSNGIPVVGFDQPALAEAIGPGGVLVPEGATDIEWSNVIETIWDDPASYGALCAQARAHASRPEVDPTSITDRFLRCVEGVR
ncbi:glycosyltransferase [Propioniciclava sinopodophylli]|uniref:Glycosyltransferase n=1 Tax=Propioniciclava sinopodophylli TaxID=1837344 RepID=A0A4Q9KBF5_9ACTN|nr:glycosyltransferase [Propioniciclava sinopodophylli]TBT83129.1 glycosyltransferase [Propioniciclava sinopodophylli]